MQHGSYRFRRPLIKGKKMTELNDASIAAALEKYCAACDIERRSPEYRGLVKGYRRNPPVFAELLDRELARLTREVQPR
jgi:hypothetical protein